MIEIKKIRLIELFAGIGAQAKALERLGVDFEHYKICEYDKFALTSYNALHGTNFTTSNICDLHGEDLEIKNKNKYLYILTYSFPCTSVSINGLMTGFEQGSGTTSSLVWEVIRLLNETKNKPDILLLENVTQIHANKNITVWNELLFELVKLGYKNFYADLNACDFNIPQNRNRTYMVSFLNSKIKNFAFPKPEPLTKKLTDILEKEVDEKYFLSKDAYKKMLPVSGRQNVKNLILAGLANSDGYTQTYNSSCRVYSENGVCPTLTCMHGGRRVPLVLLNNKRIRKLTELEMYRVMDFDDDDFYKLQEIGMSNSQLKKQAGNSICVGVLERIFKEILEAVSDG